MRCNASHYTKALSISPSKWTSCTYRVLVPTLWYYNNDSKDLLWCKKTTTCESQVREYTSFYGLLYYSTPTPLHSFFELQITPRTFSCSALKQQEPCRPQQSLTTPFFPCLSLWPYRNIISPFQAHLRSQIRAQDIYLHCWLFRESSIQNNRACFGRCICLMLCRKRDGISI